MRCCMLYIPIYNKKNGAYQVGGHIIIKAEIQIFSILKTFFCTTLIMHNGLEMLKAIFPSSPDSISFKNCKSSSRRSWHLCCYAEFLPGALFASFKLALLLSYGSRSCDTRQTVVLPHTVTPTNGWQLVTANTPRATTKSLLNEPSCSVNFYSTVADWCVRV